MLNNVVLVGRLTKDPEEILTEKNNKRTVVIMAVPRSFKNSNGEYDTDFIRVVLWNMIAEHTCEYCKKGDVIGIKGRIQSSSYEKDGETKYITEVVAEKVTFLSSDKNIQAVENTEEN